MNPIEVDCRGTKKDDQKVLLYLWITPEDAKRLSKELLRSADPYVVEFGVKT